MILAGAAAFIAAAPATEAHQQLDPDQLIAAAQRARASRDFAEALDLLLAADRERPDDPTILRLLGTTYAFQGQYRLAIYALERAHALAAGDQDIILALARAHLWSGDVRKAQEVVDAIADARQNNTEVVDLIRSINSARRGDPATVRRPIAALVQSISGVAVRGGRTTWYETIAGFSVPLGRRTTIASEIDREARGPNGVDLRLSARIDRRIGRYGVAYFEVAGTPNANFREDWGVRAGADFATTRWLAATLDLRYASYGSVRIRVVEPGVRLHRADDRLSLAMKSINLWGETGIHQNGWSFRAEGQAFDTVRLFASGATYPDTEAGITRQVRSISAGAIINLSNRVTLRTAYDRDNRTSSYTRDAGIIGIAIRL